MSTRKVITLVVAAVVLGFAMGTLGIASAGGRAPKAAKVSAKAGCPKSAGTACQTPASTCSTPCVPGSAACASCVGCAQGSGACTPGSGACTPGSAECGMGGAKGGTSGVCNMPGGARMGCPK